ncbi:D-beta-hydroxybutyrate dehydrogenase, mitochondrial-like isoform X1 [Athene cunicularia]|uniref:D-beta-hydroxybutyrate dehydrogenase, mitochondrial-like isoform X1 n=1 Tax=Athene cunicularia TaxID=194338 RepID=UPI000EF75754|nr:D-beta-hydroxybutyrate dehydrogenase, mitochondrial-like isoform X1 [Athene cunicularia]
MGTAGYSWVGITYTCPRPCVQKKEKSHCYPLCLTRNPGFWGLVNNAGISAFGETGWLSMEKYEKNADVNLLGSIRTILAFLSLLRKYKGCIVFMSSIIAYFSLGNDIYSMTKAAIEKFCDALRLEMKKFGVWIFQRTPARSPSLLQNSALFCLPCVLVFRIQVCIIQPGNYARSTKIQPPDSAEEIWIELRDEEKADYNREYVQEQANFFNSILGEGSTNGNEFVDAMVDALMYPAPKAHYMVAKLEERALVFVCALLPTVVMDSLFFLCSEQQSWYCLVTQARWFFKL